MNLNKQTFRKIILLLGVLLLVANLWTLNYEHLFSRENLGEALGAFSNIFLIAAMAVSIRHTKREQEHTSS